VLFLGGGTGESQKFSDSSHNPFTLLLTQSSSHRYFV